MDRDEVVEWIAIELLDAKRNALALDVDRQHHGFHFLTLLVIAHGRLAGERPRQIGQVHQAVDAARQTNEDTEVGDRFDHALHAVALFLVGRKIVPRVGHALLHAERDPAPILVDFQDHHFDFVAELHDLGRMDVFVGPIHLRHVHQTFDAGLDLDERAVISDVGDLAE